MITLVEVGGGALALTHRPKKTAFRGLREAGATHLVTLLTEDEGARQIGDGATEAGLTWMWIPFRGGDPPGRARDDELKAQLRAVVDAIRAGGKVVVHCSAGIHRTGMVGYAVLRLLGYAPDDARVALRRMRDLTAEGVGDERCAWGDRLAGV